MAQDFRELERVAMRAWPCFETIEYDGWVLRFADGYTKRANSVNPHFGSSLPLAEKIATCERVYAEHSLPTVFRLTGFSEPADLDEALDDAGYTTFDQTLVLVGRPGRIETDGQRRVHRVDLDGWLPGFDRLKPLEPDRRAAHHRIVATSEGRPFYAMIEDAAGPIACGLGLLVEDAVGLFDLQVDAAHRRRGMRPRLSRRSSIGRQSKERRRPICRCIGATTRPAPSTAVSALRRPTRTGTESHRRPERSVAARPRRHAQPRRG